MSEKTGISVADKRSREKKPKMEDDDAQTSVSRLSIDNDSTFFSCVTHIPAMYHSERPHSLAIVSNDFPVFTFASCI